MVSLISATCRTALDLSFLHEAIVVVHHKMRLDLLERVEYHTYHDEQRSAAEELCEVLRDAKRTGESRQNGHDTEED